ncbi:penicillin-binding protein 1A [Alkalilacustris brevis]|uniref:penicillin-binding protein 1A n=1 Tax=Alkalilacustris brevis TaxID=2026338 RepID=UPI000E0DE7A7|nr:PBP1A family penicillin-binding protein [Alkalilacustris brevis]
MLRAFLSFLGGLFSWITLGLFFAALTIGGVFWMYARELPNHEQLAQYSPPTISRIYSGEGVLMDEFAQERRLFAPIGDIPDIVKVAFISAEDKNFYSHSGFDARGIAAAAYEAVASRGQTLRGASTITQQVMKNFLLSGDRTGERKIKEIILATRIEQVLSKDRILELYLNEIFLGQNSYGVVAAAQTYFNKTLDELAPHEAAFLAALPQAPSNYHPVRAHDRVLARRNWVLGQMHENGYIDAETLEHERAQPLRSVQGGDYPAFREGLPPRDYFTDEIRRQLSGTFGEDEFFGGGLSIRATVDPDLQAVAAVALQRGLERYDRSRGVWRGTGESLPENVLRDEDSWRAELASMQLARDITVGNRWHPAVVLEVGDGRARLGIEGVAADENAPHDVTASDMDWARGGLSNLEPGHVVHVRAVTSDSDGSFQRWSLRQVPEVQGAFMAMDVNSGRVLAMQGGFSYQHSVFNRATQAQRQPGSAFKPFVYAAALDSGYTPATIVIDAPIEVEIGADIWRPSNYSDRFYGPTPVRVGIELSRNLMTVRLAREVGMEVVADYAERFGVYDRMEPFLANSLGAQETTLLDMVAAYAMFANGGQRVIPTLVDRVQDRWGQTIYRHDQRECLDCDADALAPGQAPRISSWRERVMDPVTAYQLTSMLEGVVQRGTASRIDLPVPIAGKTGTTNEARDVWFVGFSSNIAAGCYIGHDRPSPLGQGASGGGMCAPVFEEFMREAVARYGGTEFAVPPGGYFVNIDRTTGERLSADARGSHVVAEYFREGQEALFGADATIDGGFAMGENLPLFTEMPDRGEPTTPEGGDATAEDGDTPTAEGPADSPEGDEGRADFGTLSSGGLY